MKVYEIIEENALSHMGGEGDDRPVGTEEDRVSQERNASLRGDRSDHDAVTRALIAALRRWDDASNAAELRQLLLEILMKLNGDGA